MSKLLKIALGAAVLCSLIASSAFAGANPTMSGRIGWLGTNNKYLPGTNSTDCNPKMGMTVKNLQNIRGADCQLYINGGDGNLPPSWQWWATTEGSGCALGSQTVAIGFSSSGAGPAADSIYNAFTRAPAVPGVATGQQGAMYYNVNPCLTPHGVGLLWFSSTGTSGANRKHFGANQLTGPNWGLFSIVMSQTTGCPGDCDNGANPVCINVQFRQPCADPGNPRGAVLGVIDGALLYDFASCTVSFLTWNGDPHNSCPGVTSTKSGSWGSLKRAYR